MEDLTPEQLEAILGTDYETVLADILRQKGDAESRQREQKPVGQLANGHTFFDPGGIAQNLIGQYRGKKDAEAAQTKMDDILRQQKEGRRTYAQALAPKTQMPQMPPRSVDSSIPGQAPQAPPMPQGGMSGPKMVPGAPPMAPGAPPAMANASSMPPDRLARAGVPAHVQALLAKLRNR